MFKNMCVVAGFVCLLTFGCSGSGNPITPDPSDPANISIPDNLTGNADTSESRNPRYNLGFWEATISDDLTEINTQPLRMANWHLNALSFLEDQPCDNCLTISNLDLDTNFYFLSFDLTLKHPFENNKNFTIFDPRFVAYTSAADYFPEFDRILLGAPDSAWLTYDYSAHNHVEFGYTSLFNPTEFPEGGPGPALLKYFPGNYEFGNNLSATLAQYVSFGAANYRRGFFPGTEETEHFGIRILPGQPIQFGYSLDCCWANPGVQVSDPLNEFPPEANCLEAFDVEKRGITYVNWNVGSSTEVTIHVYDHQGLDTIQSVSIECPDLFNGIKQLEYDSTLPDGGFVFKGQIVNELGYSDATSTPYLVRVRDVEDDTNLGTVDA
ncbi:MAG: hypothetical protein ABIG42_01630, partial [bacterium]